MAVVSARGPLLGIVKVCDAIAVLLILYQVVAILALIVKFPLLAPLFVVLAHLIEMVAGLA